LVDLVLDTGFDIGVVVFEEEEETIEDLEEEEGREDLEEREVELFDEGAEGLPAARLEGREEAEWGLEGGGGFALATPVLAGLLGTLPGLAGGLPYVATISRMRCAFASAASTICDDTETSSDAYSVVAWGG
jgi:hypothetical protein